MYHQDKPHLMDPDPERINGHVEQATPPVQLTVDDAVEKYVGSFGFSQLLQVLFASLAWMFDSQTTLVTIFADAQPESWRCIAPECHGGGSGAAAVCGLKPGSWEWSGGNTSSTVAEWRLICHRRFLAALPTSLYFLGSVIGSVAFGWLADAFLGRKRSVLVSCLLTSATNFLTSLSPNIWIYSLVRFSNGIARAGIGICSLVLSTEFIGRNWRGQVGQVGFFFFTAGFLSTPLIAYSTRECWRCFYRIIACIPLGYSVFILIPFVSESPRWLLVKDRSEEALQVLKRYARINGKELPQNLTLVKPSIKVDERRSNPASPIRKLWGTKWAIKRLAVVMITGLGVGFMYYGIQLNVENLNFNLYLTVAINAVMEIPAVLVGSVLLRFTNRRLLFSTSSFLAGITCLACIVFARRGHRSSRGSWGQLMMEAMGFMAASTAFDVLYIYCVELFPTNVRNFAVSMLMQTLTLGASVSPVMVVLGRMERWVSFLALGVLAIVSGVVCLWLPETRNSPLFETMEQQEEAEERRNRGEGIEMGQKVQRQSCGAGV